MRAGPNTRSPIPIHDRAGATFPWSRDRRLWLSSQTLFLLNSGSEKTFGYPRHAPSLVTASGVPHTKSRRGLSFRLHIWRARTNIPHRRNLFGLRFQMN